MSALQGSGQVQATVDANGEIVDVRVLKGLKMGLTEAAVEAIKRWRFKPATLDGSPVAVYCNVTMNFHLQ